jgi:hypothetical protein
LKIGIGGTARRGKGNHKTRTISQHSWEAARMETTGEEFFTEEQRATKGRKKRMGRKKRSGSPILGTNPEATNLMK